MGMMKDIRQQNQLKKEKENLSRQLTDISSTLPPKLLFYFVCCNLKLTRILVQSCLSISEDYDLTQTDDAFPQFFHKA